jgi:hypothetical protein
MLTFLYDEPIVINADMCVYVQAQSGSLPETVSIVRTAPLSMEALFAAHGPRVCELMDQIKWIIAPTVTRKRKRHEPPPPDFLSVRLTSGVFACKGVLTKEEAVASCASRYPSILASASNWRDTISACGVDDASQLAVTEKYRTVVLPVECESTIEDIRRYAVWYAGGVRATTQALLATAGGSTAAACYRTWHVRRKDGSAWPGLEDIRTQREVAAIVARACHTSNTPWMDVLECHPKPFHVDGFTIPEYRLVVILSMCVLY